MHLRDLEETIYTCDHFSFFEQKEAFLEPRKDHHYQKELLPRTASLTSSHTWFIEHHHIEDSQIKKWFDMWCGLSFDPSFILDFLIRADTFEDQIHKRFPTAKRFSLQGCEVLIPAFEIMIQKAKALGVSTVILGMTHRGRLNVLANIFRKPKILEEFEDLDIKAGDVKYHLGYSCHRDGMDLILLSNPSHLESVSPVVSGYSKGYGRRNLPVLIHGDGAFAAQGVVYETLQLGGLAGYTVGGCIHIILDNQIAFTTLPFESRSTRFCSDIAKAFQIPVLHGDVRDVDQVCVLFEMAVLYREHFQKDIIIRLQGYRRYGHNEGDNPSFTQPLSCFKDALPAYQLYAKHHNLAIIEPKEFEKTAPSSLKKDSPSKESSYTVLELKALLNEFKAPETFHLHPKLNALYQQFQESEVCTWQMAEMLAFKTLIKEGVSIRLSGQDTVRGTFSQRHAVWFDQITGEGFYPFGEQLSILNSPLSEYAALGFEYGYALAKPKDLVIWEAQFGDFANGAQIIIDQYLSSGKVKWAQNVPLVLFLPHGMEGQGPEHSSARLERFLQLSAQENWVIASPTTPANFYHLLRMPRDCPLVVMTPKSLLRHPLCVSPWEEMTKSFQPIYIDHKTQRCAVFCTGKIYYDLVEKNPDKTIIRLEQLHPFPEDIIRALPAYKECVWLQEEPKNMGAWSYIKPYFEDLGINLRYLGRKVSSSPAGGSYKHHKEEQDKIVSLDF